MKANDGRRLVLSPGFFQSDIAILLYLALFKLILQLLVNGQYGYFRDELSYVDDGKRLDWGYVDHPPFAPVLSSLAQALFGTSLTGFRLFPALAGAGAVFVVGLTTRELGGGRFAQLATALCVLAAPIYMVSSVLFQAVSFELLFWVICSYLLVRLLKTDNPKLWPWIGLVIGLSAMNKYSVAFYVVGLALALLLTPSRKYFLSPWLWMGVLIALVIFLPNLIWQIQHNFVSLDYTRSINVRDTSVGRTEGFLPEQFFKVMNPVTTPIWLAGLYYFLFKDKRYRVLGLSFLVVLVLFVALQGRSYYLGPAYSVLLAGGSYWLEQWLVKRTGWKIAVVSLLVFGNLLIAPVLLPVLPIDSPPWKTISEINDTFPEMIGWEDLVATIGRIYQDLPAQERANTAILAGNYGEAGAVNFYGSAIGLPQAISPVNTYYYWSQGRLKADTYIVLGYSQRGLSNLQAIFGEVKQVATVTNRYGVKNEESYYNIYVCRKPKTPLEELWPSLKRYS